MNKSLNIKWVLVGLLAMYSHSSSACYGIHTLSDFPTNSLEHYAFDDDEEIQDFYQEDEVGSIFMLFIACMVLLFCFGMGLIVAILIILAILILLGIGLFTTSFLVGIYNKSLASGFKTFILTASTLGGTILGGVGIFLLFKIAHWAGVYTGVLVGALSGALAGLSFGFLVVYLFKLLGKAISRKTKKHTIQHN